MSLFASGWNLPPGCFESDLPGNSPEDEARDRFIENMVAQLDDDELDELDSIEFEWAWYYHKYGRRHHDDIANERRRVGLDPLWWEAELIEVRS
jgi:hypothetical protein